MSMRNEGEKHNNTIQVRYMYIDVAQPLPPEANLDKVVSCLF